MPQADAAHALHTYAERTCKAYAPPPIACRARPPAGAPQELVGGAAVFDPFLKAYISQHRFRTLASDDFKAFVLDYFKDVSRLACAGLGWGGVGWALARVRFVVDAWQSCSAYCMAAWVGVGCRFNPLSAGVNDAAADAADADAAADAAAAAAAGGRRVVDRLGRVVLQLRHAARHERLRHVAGAAGV